MGERPVAGGPLAVRERLAVGAAVAVAYANAFAGTFQFDDWNVIAGDPRVRSLAAWWASMPGIRPLLKLSYAANHASGLGLAGFHAVNVVLHAACALLALALLRRLEPRAAPGAPAGPAPLVAALAFALHPAQTEAVTYVSGRSTTLAACFVLASALVHVAGRDGWRPRLAGALSPALLAAALATKELALPLPALLLAIELADRRAPPSDGRGRSLASAVRATAAHWAVTAGALAAFATSSTYGRLVAASFALRGGWTNLLTHLHGVAWLAGQALRPAALDADPVLSTAARLDAVAVAAALVVAGALVAGLSLLRRHPAVALAILWTVLWLPLVGLVLPRPEPANDRQLYLSLLGAGWLVGQGGVALARRAPPERRAPGRRAAVLLGAGLCVLLGVETVRRNRVYVDEVTFWEAVLARSPENARALNNLGFALARRCRVAEAESAFLRAAAAAPGDYLPRVNLWLLREGEPLGPDGPRCPAVPAR